MLRQMLRRVFPQLLTIHYQQFFDVANIDFRCCKCWVSMLLTCDVGCYVERGGGLLMLDVARNIARNMAPTHWCLDVGRNKLATYSPQARNIARRSQHVYCVGEEGGGAEFECWSQHASQHGKIVRNINTDSTADAFPDSNRAVGEVSDASVRNPYYNAPSTNVKPVLNIISIIFLAAEILLLYIHIKWVLHVTQWRGRYRRGGSWR
jgi:hypothetical protein